MMTVDEESGGETDDRNLDDPSHPWRHKDNDGVDGHVPAAAIGCADPDERKVDKADSGHLLRPGEGVVEYIPEHDLGYDEDGHHGNAYHGQILQNGRQGFGKSISWSYH